MVSLNKISILLVSFLFVFQATSAIAQYPSSQFSGLDEDARKAFLAVDTLNSVATQLPAQQQADQSRKDSCSNDRSNIGRYLQDLKDLGLDFSASERARDVKKRHRREERANKKADAAFKRLGRKISNTNASITKRDGEGLSTEGLDRRLENLQTKQSAQTKITSRYGGFENKERRKKEMKASEAEHCGKLKATHFYKIENTPYTSNENPQSSQVVIQLGTSSEVDASSEVSQGNQSINTCTLIAKSKGASTIKGVSDQGHQACECCASPMSCAKLGALSQVAQFTKLLSLPLALASGNRQLCQFMGRLQGGYALANTASSISCGSRSSTCNRKHRDCANRVARINDDMQNECDIVKNAREEVTDIEKQQAARDKHEGRGARLKTKANRNIANQMGTIKTFLRVSQSNCQKTKGFAGDMAAGVLTSALIATVAKQCSESGKNNNDIPPENTAGGDGEYDYGDGDGDGDDDETDTLASKNLGGEGEGDGDGDGDGDFNLDDPTVNSDDDNTPAPTPSGKSTVAQKGGGSSGNPSANGPAADLGNGDEADGSEGEGRATELFDGLSEGSSKGFSSGSAYSSDDNYDSDNTDSIRDALNRKLASVRGGSRRRAPAKSSSKSSSGSVFDHSPSIAKIICTDGKNKVDCN